MSEKANYEAYAQQFLSQLPRGAFLTVRDGERINTMTIGWGSIGFMWQKPILMVMVRPSRYTYELLESAQDFSVSVPQTGELRKSLADAGSLSGHDVDKFEACNLTTRPARHIASPVIDGCGLIFECRTLLHQTMDSECLDKSLRDKIYRDEDYHDLYFGEILACYQP